jgi:hypothetical protein
MQAGIEHATSISEFDRTGAAMKQRKAKLFLKPTDLMTESSGGHVKLLGGLREAKVTSDRLKSSERVQRRKRT